VESPAALDPTCLIGGWRRIRLFARNQLEHVIGEPLPEATSTIAVRASL
jgi:hypothetical protein